MSVDISRMMYTVRKVTQRLQEVQFVNNADERRPSGEYVKCKGRMPSLLPTKLQTRGGGGIHRISKLPVLTFLV